MGKNGQRVGIAYLRVVAHEVGHLYVHAPGLFLTEDIGMSHFFDETVRYVSAFTA